MYVLFLAVPIALITALTFSAMLDPRVPQRDLRKRAEEKGLSLLRSWLTPETTGGLLGPAPPKQVAAGRSTGSSGASGGASSTFPGEAVADVARTFGVDRATVYRLKP
jgi:hypothetical protein